MKDSKDLFNAATKDLETIRQYLLDSGLTSEQINQAFERVHEMNRKRGLY